VRLSGKGTHDGRVLWEVPSFGRSGELREVAFLPLLCPKYCFKSKKAEIFEGSWCFLSSFTF
jgi:hypothetical protein